MSQLKKITPKHSFYIFPGLAIIAVILVTITGGGFAFAASQESHDAFCASCHTQPESTYLQRSTSDVPVDLASFHTAQNTHCIDCHSGQGLTGRVAAELMGARNAIKWYTGTAIQPAVLTYAIGDSNCLKCHQQVVQKGFTPQEQITLPAGGRGEGFGGEREGRNNHWHQFMTRWQAATSTAGTCVSCHTGHATGSNTQSGFMVSQTVSQVCDACHQAIRHED